MKNKREKSISELLQTYLRREGIETPLNEYRLIASWKEVLGESISRYTSDLHIHNQVLYVKLKSPALRTDLMMSRHALVRRLNDAVGAQVITDIVFR